MMIQTNTPADMMAPRGCCTLMSNPSSTPGSTRRGSAVAAQIDADQQQEHTEQRRQPVLADHRPGGLADDQVRQRDRPRQAAPDVESRQAE